MIINFQANRFRGMGISIATIKRMLYKEIDTDIDLSCFDLDHIIPYCICADNSIDNLQLILRWEHGKKSGKDRIIINKILKSGMVERFTNYSYRLNESVEVIKKEYLRLLNEVF